jgi:hypothetical protein
MQVWRLEIIFTRRALFSLTWTLTMRSQSSNTFYNPLNTHFIAMLATILKRMIRVSVYLTSVLTVAHCRRSKVSKYIYCWNALCAISHIWLSLMFIYCRYNQLFTNLITLQASHSGIIFLLLYFAKYKQYRELYKIKATDPNDVCI